MAKKRVRRAPATLADRTGEPNPQVKIAIQFFERARERLRQARAEVKPLGSKSIADLELADRLIEDLIARFQGQPPKIDLNALPAHLQPPPAPLYESQFLYQLGNAVRHAQHEGGGDEARVQLVRRIDWILQRHVGAPLQPETTIPAHKIYVMLSQGMTAGQVAKQLCTKQHSHTKQCRDRLRRTAKRYADRVGLPWPPTQ